MRWRELGGDAYRYLATVQGWTWMGGLTLVHGGLLAPGARLAARFWPGARNGFADATHALLALYLRSVLYMRVQVERAERRIDGTRVLVANHQSWLDPLVLMGIERRLHGPVRRYMLEVPVFGRIVRECGFFPGEVGDWPRLEELAQSVAVARARGGSLLFFPEGTRGEGGRVGTFHRGAFRVALDHGLPLQPVVIEGLHRVLPRRGPVVQAPGRSLVRVRYLEPVAPPAAEPGGRSGAGGARRGVVRAWAERVRRDMIAELGVMRDERTAEPVEWAAVSLPDRTR